MGPWLLSHFAAETLSWVGFATLIFAMIGEVAVWLFPDSSNAHKNLAFAFAALAVAGYTIERVGDDAITEALKTRAEQADLELTKLKSPRTLTLEQRRALVLALKPYAPQEYALSVGAGDEPAKLLCLLDSLLQEAGWTRDDPIGSIVTGVSCDLTVGVNTGTGVNIRVSMDTPAFTPGAGARSAESTLAAILNADDVSAFPAQDPKNIPKPNVIVVMVGTKQ